METNLYYQFDKLHAPLLYIRATSKRLSVQSPQAYPGSLDALPDASALADILLKRTGWVI